MTDRKELARLRKEIKIIEGSHGGYAGKSLIEKIRDDLDETYFDTEEVKKDFGENTGEYLYCLGLRDGIAHALGILRSTDRNQTEPKCDQELKLAEERYQLHQ